MLFLELNKEIPTWFKGYTIALIFFAIIAITGLYPPRLWLAFYILFILLSIPPLIAIIWEVVRKRKRLRLMVYLIILICALSLNPFIQPFFLERYDERLNHAMLNQADNLGIKGESYNRVVEIFGHPFAEGKKITKISMTEGTMLPEPIEYTMLSYYPLPYYWLGSHFEVLLVENKVVYYEIDD